MFYESTMYKFKGSRTLENIIAFAAGGFNHEEIEKQRIPLPGENESFWDNFNSPAIILIVVMSVLIVFAFCICICLLCTDIDDPPKKQKIP